MHIKSLVEENFILLNTFSFFVRLLGRIIDILELYCLLTIHKLKLNDLASVFKNTFAHLHFYLSFLFFFMTHI